MKKIALTLLLPVMLSSCYNYDGPTRAKRIPPSPKPRVLKIRPTLSSQEYLNKMAGDIERRLPDAQVTILQDSIKVWFPDNIKYDKSSILPIEDINTEIRKLAFLIRKYDKTNVLVTGHTDKSGNEQTNKRLSELRATYIKDLLVANRAPKSRVNAWGLGSSSPISSEIVAHGAENNRRVEFIILSTIEEDQDI